MREVLQFGWLPEDLAYRSSRLSVTPLADYAKAVGGIQSAGRIVSGWFYPPLTRDPNGQGIDGHGVLMHATAFSLPPSHRLEVERRSTDTWFGCFVLQVLGFTKGLRLLPSEWLHFYRAAVEVGKLTDFVCTTHTAIEVCERAQDRWLSLPDRKLERSLFGLYHWYLFGQSYEQEFERFSVQYTVMDGCFALLRKLTGMKNKCHAARPQILCNEYGIPVPEWARFDAGKNTCALTRLRNEFVHEGLYGGDPIGFAFPSGELNNVELELTNLNARLLLGILGIRGDYVRSKVGTGNIFLLEV